jgi:hypothetical protein
MFIMKKINFVLFDIQGRCHHQLGRHNVIKLTNNNNTSHNHAVNR